MGDHTETVDIEFDPAVTSYETILRLFWQNHDPCSKSYSRQYMSAIFYHTKEQRRLAQESMKVEEERRLKPIQTKILPATEFTDAENYHQKYLLRRDSYVLSTLGFKQDERLTRSYVASRLNGYVGGYGMLRDFEAEVRKLGLPQKTESYVRNMLSRNSK